MTYFTKRAAKGMGVNALFSQARRRFFLVVATVLVASALALPAHAGDEDAKIKEAMQSLKDGSAALGAVKLDGENLYFGATKINGDYTLVDAIKAKHGATATFFVKKADNFVRVSTNVMKGDQRAVGTILDVAGPAYAAIKQGKPFYGLVDILGKIYDTGYEPIKDASGNIIGIYYVGYLME